VFLLLLPFVVTTPTLLGEPAAFVGNEVAVEFCVPFVDTDGEDEVEPPNMALRAGLLANLVAITGLLLQTVTAGKFIWTWVCTDTLTAASKARYLVTADTRRQDDTIMCLYITVSH
jgi:hypothetical protein